MASLARSGSALRRHDQDMQPAARALDFAIDQSGLLQEARVLGRDRSRMTGLLHHLAAAASRAPHRGSIAHSAAEAAAASLILPIS
jgi:hypothetical protein